MTLAPALAAARRPAPRKAGTTQKGATPPSDGLDRC
jgi:hypothetical protein